MTFCGQWCHETLLINGPMQSGSVAVLKMRIFQPKLHFVFGQRDQLILLGYINKGPSFVSLGLISSIKQIIIEGKPLLICCNGPIYLVCFYFVAWV